MKTLKLLATIKLFCILISTSVFAGGYVGNGGGLAEQNFNYAYTALPRTIESTIFTRKDLFNQDELELLAEIKAIALKNASNEDRLTFVSGKDFPDLFKTGPAEHHRIAVTGDSETSEIFINTDLLYSSEGASLLDLGTQSAILVHEIGHQAGELNHQKLDILGSKIRAHFNQSSKHHEIQFKGKEYDFILVNHQGEIRTAELMFQDSEQLQSLNPDIFVKLEALKISKGYLGLSGFQLINGNFKLELFPGQLVFQAWISATYSSANGYLNELIPVEFEILSDGSLKELQSK